MSKKPKAALPKAINAKSPAILAVASKSLPAVGDAATNLPFEVEELNKELVAFLATPFDVPGAKTTKGKRLGAVQWGVYAFFDYDDEPIYVGQTNAQHWGQTTVYFRKQPWVAVGTTVTRRPPHRSVRAELPHTAPAAGDDATMFMFARRCCVARSRRPSSPIDALTRLCVGHAGASNQLKECRNG